jgi:cell division protein FtsW (lipid II flippase)
MTSTVAIATATAVAASNTNHGHLPAAMWQLIMLGVCFIFCKLWLFNDDVTEKDRKEYGIYVYFLLAVFSIGLMIFCEKVFGK